MTFKEIKKLIRKSQKPLKSKKLEALALSTGDKYNHVYYRFLYHLSNFLSPSVCLELGAWLGVGAKHLAKGCPTATVIAVDIHEIRFKNKNIHFVDGNSTWPTTLEKIKGYGKIDILYQDSSHHYEASVREWEMYSPLMSDGGVWVCDDIGPTFYDRAMDPENCSMVEYFEQIPMKEKKLYKDVLHKGCSQGIILF